SPSSNRSRRWTLQAAAAARRGQAFWDHSATLGIRTCCGWSFGQYLLAVAVVALRQPRRVQRRNGSHGPLGLREAFAPLHAALPVAARRVLPRETGTTAHLRSADFGGPSHPRASAGCVVAR